MTQTLSQQGSRALSELGVVLSALPDHAADSLVEAITKARRIVVYGCGREGLALKGFAMRLFHLGLDVHVLADMTVPHLGSGDLLIVTCGTGHLPSGETFMQIAKKDGARTAVITSQPTGSTPAMADADTVLPAQTKANDQTGTPSVLPMGSLFEIAETIFFELVILKVRDALGETSETMRARHTNLE
jgi:6-phospho-3-hexuloisomerase